MKLVSRLLRRRVRPASPSPRDGQRLRPQVCALEDRRLMAAYIGSNGALVLDGTETADRVIVSDTVVNGARHYMVEYNGTVETVAASRVTNGTVEFSGRGGDDYFLSVASLRVAVAGDAGNDTVYGGSGHDTLSGGAGDDELHGWLGNDVLDGGDGADELFGFSGDDTLAGGEGADRLTGGDGANVLDAGSEVAPPVVAPPPPAVVLPAVRDLTNGAVFQGTSATDVVQGFAPACWINSAMGAAARAGVDFSSRIRYLGNDNYQVGLYDPQTLAYGYQTVYFDGTRYAADPQPNPDQPGEFWPVLMQRAFLQQQGLSLTNPPAGWPDLAQTAFNGRRADNVYFTAPPDASVVAEVARAVNAGSQVIVYTRPAKFQLTDARLIENHTYTVVAAGWDGLGEWSLILLNPWGVDGALPDGDPADGQVSITGTTFRTNMAGYSVV